MSPIYLFDCFEAQLIGCSSVSGPCRGVLIDLGRVNAGSSEYLTATSGGLGSPSYAGGAFAQVMAQNDRKAASKELAKTASRFQRQNRELAMALLDAALDLNAQNEVAKNLLGQMKYFAGDYQEAVSQLASVRDRDNRAKLFHGRAALYLARETDNRPAATQARKEIVDALEFWAFGNQDSRERMKWLRQVGELDGLGAEFHQTVDELLDYANDYASWQVVSRFDLSASTSLAEDSEGV